MSFELIISLEKIDMETLPVSGLNSKKEGFCIFLPLIARDEEEKENEERERNRDRFQRN